MYKVLAILWHKNLAHYQYILRIPSASQRKKGLLYLFFSHDCHLPLIWQLHLYVRETLSQTEDLLSEGSRGSQYLCCPTFEPLYLYSTEPAGEASL